MSADGGQPTWIFLPDDARDNYLPRMEWIDSKELVLQRNQVVMLRTHLETVGQADMVVCQFQNQL